MIKKWKPEKIRFILIGVIALALTLLVLVGFQNYNWALGSKHSYFLWVTWIFITLLCTIGGLVYASLTVLNRKSSGTRNNLALTFLTLSILGFYRVRQVLIGFDKYFLPTSEKTEYGYTIYPSLSAGEINWVHLNELKGELALITTILILLISLLILTIVFTWKRMKNKQSEYKCAECGQIHSDWPALVFKSPANYDSLSDQEKTALGKLDSDFCEIHYKDQIDRFIRVTLTQKVTDTCENLEYGLWVSLSEKSYTDYKANFDKENHETKYFGWLCSNIPEYENTMSIPCDVITKAGNKRPEIFPHQDFDHPFVRDYYEGISKEEAENRISNMTKNLT